MENKIKIEKDDGIVLSYLNKDLNEFNIGEKDKELLLKLIENNIDELTEEYKIKLNALYQNPTYLALIRYKKKLLDSKKTEFKFKEIPDEIKKQYKIIHNILQNNLLKRIRYD